jgi:outer membrane protein TolC
VTVHDDGSYTLNQYADFPSQSMNWKLKNIFVGSVSLMEPIYAGGKISTAYEMSKLGVNMAQENIRLTESEVVVKTYEAYYLAVKAKELGEVARSYKTLLDELKKNVEGAFRHGMSTRNDIMKVQVKQNEAELAIQKADNNYQLALMNLCHIIGLPLTSEVGVGQPETPTQTSLPAEKGMRPEQVILDNKTELARQNVKLTKSDYLPNVAVGATYFYANGGELAGKKLVDNGSASVGVVVKMPLDLFGGSTNKIRSAKAAYQIAQMEQQDIDEQLELEWAQCRNLYDEAQTEYRLSQVSLDQAAENMRLSKQQYEVGFETLADYLETQAQWQQCNAALVNARCQLQLTYVRLLKASGTLH